MLFHSDLSKVQVDWLSGAIATTKPAPSSWDETTWQLQLFRLLLFLLLKTHTTNYSAGCRIHNCVCFWITACMQLWHGISVANLLQGAVGKPQFWWKTIHGNIILGSNQNILLRLSYLISMPSCPLAIISHQSGDAALVQWSSVLNVVMVEPATSSNVRRKDICI